MSLPSFNMENSEAAQTPYAFVSPRIHGLAFDGPPEPPPAPVASAVAAATPTILPAPAKWSEADIRALICSYSWDCATALRIAHCESQYRSIQNLAGGPYFGIFQLWSGHFRAGEDWRDPATNIAVAWRVYQSSGWSPWECR